MGERGEIKGGESSGKGGGHIIPNFFIHSCRSPNLTFRISNLDRDLRALTSPPCHPFPRPAALRAHVHLCLNLNFGKRLRIALRGPSSLDPIKYAFIPAFHHTRSLTNLTTTPVVTYSMHLTRSHALLLAGGMREPLYVKG
jgi:hypothetical protein